VSVCLLVHKHISGTTLQTSTNVPCIGLLSVAAARSSYSSVVLPVVEMTIDVFTLWPQ